MPQTSSQRVKVGACSRGQDTSHLSQKRPLVTSDHNGMALSLMTGGSMACFDTLLGSHGVFASPLLGGSLVLWSVSLEDLSNLGHQRIIWVGVGEKGGDGQQHLGDGEGWRPLLLQDVQTD